MKLVLGLLAVIMVLIIVVWLYGLLASGGVTPEQAVKTLSAVDVKHAIGTLESGARQIINIAQ